MSSKTQAGLVSIVGRPNVGKSTLMNALVGHSLALATPRANTTRERIHGVYTKGLYQAVFVDTPGFTENPKRALGRYMNKEVTQALCEVDVILWVLEKARLTDLDRLVMERLVPFEGKLLVILNKTDGVAQKTLLEGAHRIKEELENLKPKGELVALVPISAKKGHGVASLLQQVLSLLPPSPFLYEEEQLSNRGERFFVSEWIRLPLIHRLSHELPHRTAVIVDSIKDEGKIVFVNAYIICERTTQRAILLGRQGAHMKAIATEARVHLERYFQKKVMLKIWVKVMPSWSDEEELLKKLGYHD